MVEARSGNKKDKKKVIKEEVKDPEDESEEAALAATKISEEDSKDLGALSIDLDKGTRRLMEEGVSENNLKSLERHPVEIKVAKESVTLPKSTMMELVNEAVVDTNLKDLERRQGRPPSDSFV